MAYARELSFRRLANSVYLKPYRQEVENKAYPSNSCVLNVCDPRAPKPAGSRECSGQIREHHEPNEYLRRCRIRLFGVTHDRNSDHRTAARRENYRGHPSHHERYQRTFYSILRSHRQREAGHAIHLKLQRADYSP